MHVVIEYGIAQMSRTVFANLCKNILLQSLYCIILGLEVINKHQWTVIKLEE